MPLPRLILLILDLLFITGFLAFAIVSMIEGQRRAAQLSTALTALSGLALTALFSGSSTGRPNRSPHPRDPIGPIRHLAGLACKAPDRPLPYAQSAGG